MTTGRDVKMETSQRESTQKNEFLNFVKQRSERRQQLVPEIKEGNKNEHHMTSTPEIHKVNQIHPVERINQFQTQKLQ